MCGSSVLEVPLLLCAPIRALDTTESKPMLRVVRTPQCGPHGTVFHHVTFLHERADGIRHQGISDDSRRVPPASLAHLMGSTTETSSLSRQILPRKAGGLAPYTQRDIETCSQDEWKTAVSREKTKVVLYVGVDLAV